MLMKSHSGNKQTKATKRPRWKVIKKKKNLSFLIYTEIEHTSYSLAISVLGIHQKKCAQLRHETQVGECPPQRHSSERAPRGSLRKYSSRLEAPGERGMAP